MNPQSILAGTQPGGHFVRLRRAPVQPPVSPEWEN
jgi:hypothetical protein